MVIPVDSNDRASDLLDLASRALVTSSEAAWWQDVAAAVSGSLFAAVVMALNVVNANDMYGWFGLVFPVTARIRMPVNSPMDAVLTHEHPFTHRTRVAPVTAPMKVTDLVSDREWRNSAPYERMRFLTGGTHHMVLQIPRSAPYNETVSIVRADRDFDAGEMIRAERLQSVIQLAIPHLRHVERRQQRWGPLVEHEMAMAAAAVGVTHRERAVLDLLDSGAASETIAMRLAISPRTVHKHQQNIYRKLGVTNARNAVLRAHRLGLLANDPSSQQPPVELAPRLSHREIAVLDLLATGMTNSMIADALEISSKTVDCHIGALLRKFGARTRTEAVMTAVRSGLLA